MTRRKRRHYGWLILLGVIVLLFVFALFALFSRPVQTALAHRVLASVNRGLNGRIEVGAVDVSPSGVFDIIAASLVGADGPVLQADRVRGRIHLFSLLNQSLDLDSIIIEGLRADIKIDSSGNPNVADIFAGPSPKEEVTEPGEPWRAHIWRIEISSEAVNLRQGTDTLFETKQLHVSASVGLEPTWLAVHRLEVESDGLALSGRGTWPLTERETGAGKVAVSATTQKLRPLLGSVACMDTIQALLYYELSDSLDVRLALDWLPLGAVTAAATVAWPIEQPTGSVNGRFFGLRPEYLVREMEHPVWINGAFDLRGTGSSLETADIDGQLTLRNSDYGPYEIHRADLEFVWREVGLRLRGKIHSSSGSATVAVRGADLFTAMPHYEGEITVRGLRVQDFAPTAPPDLMPLDGSLRAELHGTPPFGSEGAVEAALAPTTFRRFAADTLVVHAAWHGRSVEVSRLYASYGGISVEAEGAGILDSAFHVHTELQVSDAHELASELPIPSDVAETIMGALSITTDADFKLTAQGLSEFKARGRLDGQSLAGGPCSARQMSMSVDSFTFSPLFAAGKVVLWEVLLAGHQADTVTLFFEGTPETLAVNLAAALPQDSLRFQLEGVFTQDSSEGFIADLHALEAEVLSHRWALQKPARIALGETQFSLTDFDLRSDVGALHAMGRLSAEGQQDFVVDLSDFQIARIRENLPVPDAIVSAHVHISGLGQLAVARFDVAAESLRWDEKAWLDLVIVHGELEGDSLAVRGLAIWLGDTLAVFTGSLPMTLSFSEGLNLWRDKPVAGHLRVYRQPLPKLQPFLPWGVSVGGSVEAEVDVSGTLQQPYWQGNFVVEDGLYEDVVHGVRYEKIYLKGSWRGDTLLVEQMKTTAVGKAEGHGGAVMAFPLPKSLDLRATFKRFQIVKRADLRAKITGDVEVEGPLLGLRANGNLTIDELRYRITSATTKYVEPIDLESELAKLRGDTVIGFRLPGTLIYEKMDHALRVTLPRNCWVHGGGISVELAGDVWLYKLPDEPEQVYGQIRVVRGSVTLYARKLTIQEGTVTFDGDLQDPNLDITAIETNLKRSRNVEIVLRLRGTKNHPEIELSGQDADGELTSEDIVSYLTLGRRATGGATLSSGARASEEPALGMAASGISSGLSRVVSQALRLEVFEYRPGQGEAGGLTRGELEVGAYVTDNLFVSIVQSMEKEQTGQEVILEYQVLPWLRLRGTRQTEGESGFDLFFQWEWR